MFALLIVFAMCLDHVSLESKQTTKAFICVVDLMGTLFRMISTGGVSFCRRGRVQFWLH